MKGKKLSSKKFEKGAWEFFSSKLDCVKNLLPSPLYFRGLNSTEFVSINQKPIKGPDFPFTIRWHGMIQYDNNSIYLIGGFQNDSVSKRTWIFNPSNEFQIQEGPSLKIERREHICGKIKIQGTHFLVVAGGINESYEYLDSVELLDPLSNEGWILGKSR